MSSLHNFVFFIVGLMLLIWIGKSLSRLRSIYSLWRAVKQRRVLRVEGLRNQNQLSRDMFQQAILAQCVQTSKKVDNVILRSHLIKESARVFVNAEGRPCLSFKLEATAHTKIDVFVGVQQAALLRIVKGGSDSKNKKKKDDYDMINLLKESDYLHKTISYAWVWGSPDSVCIPLEASWFSFLSLQPVIHHSCVIVLTSVHNPHEYTVAPQLESRLLSSPSKVGLEPAETKDEIVTDSPNTLPVDYKVCQATVAFYTPEAKSALEAPSLSSQVARIQFDAQLVCTEKNIVEISHLYGLEEDGYECTICFSAIKDVILLPCRHISVCNTCRPNLQQRCPVCRGGIQSYMKFGDDKLKL